MKSIFFAGLVLFTQVASASDGVVCIANDAGNDVRWTIRDSQGELLRTRDQRSENRWRCQRGDFPKAAVTVRVSLKKDQYSAPSCYAQIFGNEWVVTTQKGSQIQCEVRNESGVQTSRVEYKSILKAERIRLFGEASFGQAINGGNARLVDRDGTVFGSAPVGSDGVFAIPLQSLPEDERPLFVEIDGIKEVPGKLTASVPQDFDYSIDNLGVNLATTLAVKSGDEDAVKQYLELKSFQDLGIALTHAPQTLFPSEAIAAKARKERSLDGVIDNMIRDMRDGQVVSQSFAAVATAAAPRLKAAVPVPSEHEIGDALVKLVDNPAFTAALTAAGWKSESQRTAESLEEIKRQLTVITSMLHQVLAEQAYAAYNVSMGELNPIMVRIDQSLDRYGILMNRWPNIVDANGNVRPGKQSDHKNQLNDIADLRKRIKDDTGFRSFIGDSLSRMTGKNLEGGTTQIGDNDAMQRIYAIYLLNQPEYRAIDKRFYQELDRHLLRFKAYQAKTVLLFALAYADPKASMVEVQRADYTKASFLMMNVYYPKTAEGEFFSMLGGGSMLGEAVRAGRFIYDRDGATLWSSVPLVTTRRTRFEPVSTSGSVRLARTRRSASMRSATLLPVA